MYDKKELYVKKKKKELYVKKKRPQFFMAIGTRGSGGTSTTRLFIGCGRASPTANSPGGAHRPQGNRRSTPRTEESGQAKGAQRGQAPIRRVPVLLYPVFP